MADRPSVDCRGKTGDAVGRSLLLENNQVLPQPVLPDPIRLLGWNHSVVGPEDGSDVSQMAEQEEISLVCALRHLPGGQGRWKVMEGRAVGESTV